MIKESIILWDFDGVIMNSNSVRDLGFEKVLNEFPIEQVNLLMKFHRENGGLSRYVKFRYFFEEIRKEEVTEKEVVNWAKKFSFIMLEELSKESLLINETLSYVKENYQDKKMHIVSASDQNELRQICEKFNITQFFNSIHGSPTSKSVNIKELLENCGYDSSNVALIGDSINDYNAAMDNNISFYGYNNLDLEKLGIYIKNF